MKAPVPALLLTCTLLSQLLAPSAARADIQVECHAIDPHSSGCTELVLLVDLSQFVIRYEPICEVCGHLEIPDLDVLRGRTPEDLFETLPKDWKASIHPTLEQPAEGVADSPNTPNLRLNYFGSSRINGPAKLGSLKLRAPFALPPHRPFVGRAFDRQTGQPVTNVGTVSVVADPEPEPNRSRPLLLVGLVALALVVGAASWYRSRRR
ncbi:MAG TPA: hypothetical protein VF017_06885 [Thermoanaerobaculia bacterium]|nr:hypothetical protein [Thermoanaerobaculia bacterium]